MLLPANFTNRRKFLERTALGAGSVLFLPGLLTGCADHRIPDPGTPTTPVVGSPVVGDESYDWNDEAKTIVVAGLNLIPELGGLLSGLTSIFWPGTDVWSQVRDQVEALVDKKLDDFVYNSLQTKLVNLKDVIDPYLAEIKAGSKDMASIWFTTQDHFNGAKEDFKMAGYEVLLLPFYAQFVNMHLALQRDVVVAGKSWGKNDTEQALDIKNLQDYISEHLAYVQSTYTVQEIALTASTTESDFLVEPFTTVNRYTRETTLTVLDYTKFWPYYDVIKYPNGAKVSLPRELYSDPVGSQGSLSGPIRLPKPPTQGPTELTIWGSTDGVDAVQLTYPPGSGPDGVTTTPRRGRQDGGGCGSSGTTDQPYGLKLQISPTNPLVRARFQTDIRDNTCSFIVNTDTFTALRAMQFELHDGTTINKVGADDEIQNNDWAGIPDHFISSIYINGSIEDMSNVPSIADCVVFGFKYLTEGPSVTSRTLERLYVTNPRELSGADLAQASPTYGAANALITGNLKATRQAYWERIAKAPK